MWRFSKSIGLNTMKSTCGDGFRRPFVDYKAGQVAALRAADVELERDALYWAGFKIEGLAGGAGSRGDHLGLSWRVGGRVGLVGGYIVGIIRHDRSERSDTGVALAPGKGPDGGGDIGSLVVKCVRLQSEYLVLRKARICGLEGECAGGG